MQFAKEHIVQYSLPKDGEIQGTGISKGWLQLTKENTYAGNSMVVNDCVDDHIATQPLICP